MRRVVILTRLQLNTGIAIVSPNPNNRSLHTGDQGRRVGLRRERPHQSDVVYCAIIRVEHRAQSVAEGGLGLSQLVAVEPLCAGERRPTQTFYTGLREGNLKDSQSIEWHADAGALGQLLDVCGIPVSRRNREVVGRSRRALDGGGQHSGSRRGGFTRALVAYNRNAQATSGGFDGGGETDHPRAYDRDIRPYWHS